MSDLDDFEAMAERFHKETGYMHPGKDAPSEGSGASTEERRAAARVWQRMDVKVAALRKALGRLANEVAGVVGCAEHEMRAAIGNTNLAVLRLRVDEAEAALLQTSSLSHPPAGEGK